MKKIKTSKVLGLLNSKFGKYEQLMGNLLLITKLASHKTEWSKYSTTGKLSKQSQIELVTNFTALVILTIKGEVKNQTISSILVTDYGRSVYRKLLNKLPIGELRFTKLLMEKFKVVNMGRVGKITKQQTKNDVKNFNILFTQIFGEYKSIQKLMALQGTKKLIQKHIEVCKQTMQLLK